MGNKAHELINAGKTVLFAFEEAIGFMFSSTVLDKDGVSAAAHLASLTAYLAQKNQTLFGKLNELYERYGFHYTSNSYFICYDAEVIAKIFERIRNFQRAPDTVCIKSVLISFLIMWFDLLLIGDVRVPVSSPCAQRKVSDFVGAGFDNRNWYMSDGWKIAAAFQQE